MHLKSLVAATVLSVPHLILPATPAGAACETNESLGHRGAALLTAGACASHVTLEGLHIDPWRSREAGKLARIAEVPGSRWDDGYSDHIGRFADGGGAWSGSREMTGHDLLFVSSSLFVVTDSAAPGGHWLALDWQPAAPMRIAIEHDRRGDGLVDPFGADCERNPLPAPAPPPYRVGDRDGDGDGDGDGVNVVSAGYRYELGDSLTGAHPPARVALTEWLPPRGRGALGYPTGEPTPRECDGDGSGGPSWPWRTANGMSPSTPDRNGEGGTRAEPGAALAFGPHRPRELGEASLAQLHAYAHSRIEWNGHRRVALSGLCFESEGRGRC